MSDERPTLRDDLSPDTADRYRLVIELCAAHADALLDELEQAGRQSAIANPADTEAIAYLDVEVRHIARRLRLYRDALRDGTATTFDEALTLACVTPTRKDPP